MEDQLDIDRWLSHIEKRGIQRLAGLPMDRLFRQLGIKIRPMIFWPYSVIFIFTGAWFALIFGTLFSLWTSNGAEFDSSLILTTLVAVFSGGWGAVVIRIRKKQLGLTTWKKFVLNEIN